MMNVSFAPSFCIEFHRFIIWIFILKKSMLVDFFPMENNFSCDLRFSFPRESSSPRQIPGSANWSTGMRGVSIVYADLFLRYISMLPGCNKLDVFQNRCLRRILPIYWPNTITNEELHRRAEIEPISTQVKRRRWRWIGHVLRQQTTALTRIALRWTPDGQRKRGCPKETWRRTVEKEMKEKGWTWGRLERVSADQHQACQLGKPKKEENYSLVPASEGATPPPHLRPITRASAHVYKYW